jgi:hypothetical protein
MELDNLIDAVKSSPEAEKNAYGKGIETTVESASLLTPGGLRNDEHDEASCHQRELLRRFHKVCAKGGAVTEDVVDCTS